MEEGRVEVQLGGDGIRADVMLSAGRLADAVAGWTNEAQADFFSQLNEKLSIRCGANKETQLCGIVDVMDKDARELIIDLAKFLMLEAEDAAALRNAAKAGPEPTDPGDPPSLAKLFGNETYDEIREARVKYNEDLARWKAAFWAFALASDKRQATLAEGLRG